MVLKFTINLIMKKRVLPQDKQILFRKKHSRLGKRIEIGLKEKFNKNGSVDFEKCLSNKNNNIKEEKKKTDRKVSNNKIFK